MPHTQAYNKRLLWRRGEATLPNLDLSPQQLFFLSYAQVGSCHRPPTRPPRHTNTSPNGPTPSAVDAPAVVLVRVPLRDHPFRRLPIPPPNSVPFEKEGERERKEKRKKEERALPLMPSLR